MVDEAPPPVLRQWRCIKCGRVLGHYQEPVACVRVTCKSCKSVNELTTTKVAA